MQTDGWTDSFSALYGRLNSRHYVRMHIRTCGYSGTVCTMVQLYCGYLEHCIWCCYCYCYYIVVTMPCMHISD